MTDSKNNIPRKSRNHNLAPIPGAEPVDYNPTRAIKDATSVTSVMGGDEIVCDATVVPFDSLEEGRSPGGNSSPRQRSYRNVILVTCALLVALIVTIPLAVLQLSSRSGSNVESPFEDGMSPARPTSMAPPKADQDEAEMIQRLVHSHLPNSTLRAVEEDPRSPQARAYEWIMKDPSVTDLPDWKMKQRFALATFYYAFRGQSWDSGPHSWLSFYKDECHWDAYYNACPPKDSHSGGDGRIRVVAPTRRFYLQGMIPLEFSSGFLPELQVLDFSFNSFKTLDDMIQYPLPSSLQEFACSDCDLAGSIPSKSFVAVDALQSINLSHNHLESTIPSELSLLTKLTNLELEDNQLEGNIPSELALLGNLTTLNLMNNPNLEPFIPREFCTTKSFRIDSLVTDWCQGEGCCHQ